jgi:hypothetical protein
MKSIANQINIKTLQILNWLFFFAMITANYLANALPFNGKTTGELSDQYPNLFVPAPITFAIWGVIYVILLFFCIQQSKAFFSKTIDSSTNDLVKKIGFRFIITCILNIFWILAWHYEHLFFSVLVMVSLLIQLIDINSKINKLEITRSFIIKSSFGVYLGWICIAIIANITALLVYFGWEGMGQSPSFWTCFMILLGAVIVSWTLLKLQNSFIGIAVLWAFIGILIARIGAVDYYRFIVWTTVFGIVIVGTSLIIETTKSVFKNSR